MALITINVPDNKLSYYKQMLAEFKDISFENKADKYEKIFTPKMIQDLEARRSVSLDESITLNELKSRIKVKYADYGF
jgi:hypothetical protein